MKKYLKLLFVAIFATMTFVFTACGDDEDEPNFGKGVVGELTVNGAKQQFRWIDGEIDEYSFYRASLVTTDYQNGYVIGMADVRELKEGDRITSTLGDNTIGLSQGFVFTIDATPYHKHLESGSITIEKIDSESVTIKFDNAVISSIYTTMNCKINGTIKLPINGEYGSYV